LYIGLKHLRFSGTQMLSTNIAAITSCDLEANFLGMRANEVADRSGRELIDSGSPITHAITSSWLVT
jgi:hypothetical protein